jgi:predicted phosphate transport protein (TIGR00153 family)
MKFSFLPADIKFYDYFERASANLLEGANNLQKMIENTENIEETAAQITEIEHRGDFIVHEVTSLLPRTLITPFDSDDIQRLVSTLDDALDAVDAVSQRLLIYRLTEIKKPARRLAHLITESAQELDAAVRGLRDKGQYKQVRERVVQINTLENNGDRVLHDGLINLVQHHEDVFEFICWKEIYELLEDATDRIEDAGDVIQKVIIANA